MTKKTLIILAIFVPIIVTAIVVGVLSFSTKEEKVEDLILNADSITLELDESIRLNDYFRVSPKSSKAVVMCLVSDSYYAKITGENILTAKNIGNTVVYLKVNAGSNNFIEKSINIVIKEKSVIPTEFSFEKSEMNLGVNSVNIINRIICNEEYNVSPTISYSNANICSYNYLSGEITPINIGSTTITITFSLNGEIVSRSFNVFVKEIYRTLQTDYPKENEYYIINTEANKSKTIAVKMYEDDERVYKEVEVDILNNDAGVSIIQNEMGNLVIKSLNKGESILKISCVDDNSVYILIKIKGE